MKIEAGKYYLNGNSLKIKIRGPIKYDNGLPTETFLGFDPFDTPVLYDKDGRYAADPCHQGLGLVSEYREPEKVVRYAHLWRSPCGALNTYTVPEDQQVPYRGELLARKRIEITEGEFDE